MVIQKTPTDTALAALHAAKSALEDGHTQLAQSLMNAAIKVLSK